MRWPFGPPHLTLKPSKKTEHKKQKQNKSKNNTKNPKKTKTKKEKVKNTKTPKKELFSYQSKFSFLTGYPKIAFLTPWPRKRAPKNTIKIGVSACFFWKEVMRHETAIFGQKKPNSEIPVIIFFLAFFLFQKQKTQKSAETLFL